MEEVPSPTEVSMSMRALFFATVGSRLLAQSVPVKVTSEPGIPSWLELMIQVGSFGVVCFVVWYVFTKLIPSITLDFKTSMEALMKDNAEARDMFQRELANNRQAFAAQIQSERDISRARDETMIEFLKEQLDHDNHRDDHKGDQ